MLKEVMQVAMENPEVTIASLVAFGMAFSVATRKAIGQRDKWHCQEEGCDASFQNGDMVHAAHKDHNKNNPLYDSAETGEILCVEHHYQQHLNARGHAVEDLGMTCEQANEYAIRKLAATPRKRG